MPALQSAAPSLDRFLGWWLGELGSLVPSPLRAVMAARRGAIMFEATQTGVEVGRLSPEGRSVSSVIRADSGSRRARSLLRAARRKRSRVFVRLSADDVLFTTILVPVAARKNLRAVVGFQIEKQTPFRTDEVFFGCRANGRADEAGQIRIGVLLVPRETVRERLDQVRALGCEPTGILVCRSDRTGEDDIIDLVENGRSRAIRQSHARAKLILAGLAIALAAAAIVLPFENQRRELRQAQETATFARESANKTLSLASRIATTMERRYFVVHRKREMTPMVQVINDLTRRMPDDVWVAQLTATGSTVRVHAFAPSAPQLVAILEDTPEFRNVELVSKVVRNAAAGIDDFQLKLQPEAP